VKDVSLIVYPAADMAAAKQFFKELIGADPYVEGPPYVGFKSGNTEIGLVPNQNGRPPAGLAYWDVDDIAARIEALKAAGGAVVQEITDVGYGMLVASVKDANGVAIGLRQQPKG
jgi:predicted enzyme related to lactoylglutathione lyase